MTPVTSWESSHTHGLATGRQADMSAALHQEQGHVTKGEELTLIIHRVMRTASTVNRSGEKSAESTLLNSNDYIVSFVFRFFPKVPQKIDDFSFFINIFANLMLCCI